jgi:hypothetical protein
LRKQPFILLALITHLAFVFSVPHAKADDHELDETTVTSEEMAFRVFTVLQQFQTRIEADEDTGRTTDLVAEMQAAVQHAIAAYVPPEAKPALYKRIWAALNRDITWQGSVDAIKETGRAIGKTAGKHGSAVAGALVLANVIEKVVIPVTLTLAGHQELILPALAFVHFEPVTLGGVFASRWTAMFLRQKNLYGGLRPLFGVKSAFRKVRKQLGLRSARSWLVPLAHPEADGRSIVVDEPGLFRRIAQRLRLAQPALSWEAVEAFAREHGIPEETIAGVGRSEHSKPSKAALLIFQIETNAADPIRQALRERFDGSFVATRGTPAFARAAEWTKRAFEVQSMADIVALLEAAPVGVNALAVAGLYRDVIVPVALAQLEDAPYAVRQAIEIGAEHVFARAARRGGAWQKLMTDRALLDVDRARVQACDAAAASVLPL